MSDKARGLQHGLCRSCGLGRRGCEPLRAGAHLTSGMLDKRVYGAVFLMATSAIGPGFITQTTQFTAQLGAAFAFAILLSIFVHGPLQRIVWRVISVSRLRAHELGERVALGRVMCGEPTAALGPSD